MAAATGTILTIITTTMMAAVAGSGDGGGCGSNGNFTRMLVTATSTGWQQGPP